MAAPTIVIVPGMWLGPRTYELLAEEIKKIAPLDVVYAPLKSTGKKSPGNPSMFDDAMGVREIIKPLVESGKRLVLVGHSAGAFISGMATEGLEIGQELAGNGGVEKFIFIAGGILPVGAPHPEMGMLEIKDGAAYCQNQDELLFHDVDLKVAATYRRLLECQPAEGWMGKCTYTGWDKVSSDYILTENDRIILPQIQEICSSIAKSNVIRIPTGHMPMLSDPEMLADKIVSCLNLNQ